MRTLRCFTHAVQVRWLPTLILAFLLLAVPAADAASHATSAHFGPVVASGANGPDLPCGAAVLSC